MHYMDAYEAKEKFRQSIPNQGSFSMSVFTSTRVTHGIFDDDEEFIKQDKWM